MTEQVLSETILVNGQPAKEQRSDREARCGGSSWRRRSPSGVDIALWEAAFDDLKKRDFFGARKRGFADRGQRKNGNRATPGN